MTTNYIQNAIDDLEQRLPDCDFDLIELYALLALTVPETDTVEQVMMSVHEAWGVWRNRTNPEHKSLIPFDQLDQATQEYDRKYAEAILATAKAIGR
jgi:hypothetical protein